MYRFLHDHTQVPIDIIRLIAHDWGGTMPTENDIRSQYTSVLTSLRRRWVHAELLAWAQRVRKTES